jgi:eukaryotic-like serine/threonine-protein kinase
MTPRLAPRPPSTIASRVTLVARSGLPVGALVTLGVLALGALAGWTWAAVGAGLCIGVVVGVRRALRAQSERVRTFGAYTLDEKIGEGGMGVVYRASHALLRRPAAIKLLSPERTRARDFERFEREVQLTSQLSHPNTISIYDFGRTADGAFYYAMEYVDGSDLETLVEREGPQEPARVARLLAQLSGALREAHDIGLVHRDIKPANVMLCRRGGVSDVVKVLDFGLIKRVGEPSDTPRSAVNQIVGTPLYLSPEALTSPERMDGRSDIYAVGAVGYFLLTGEPPFTGGNILEICGHHLHSAPVPPSRRLGRPVPAALEQLILRCLAKQAERRPDAATLEAELRRFLTPASVAELAA